jgi:superfamily II DNA helicase RecQ
MALDTLLMLIAPTSNREPQDQVILNALSGNDSLVVMATGGGKSICYQVPPLVTGEHTRCCRGRVLLGSSTTCSLGASSCSNAQLCKMPDHSG